MDNDLISREYIRKALNEAFGCENATKYGNENADQQAKSYSTLMLYEIADTVEDVCDNAPTVDNICPYLSDEEVKQPCLQAPCERQKKSSPMFNRTELKKALEYFYQHIEVNNKAQNEAAWCAINAIRYCIENDSDYQKKR